MGYEIPTCQMQHDAAAGAQFEGDLGKILAQGAEISPYIGLREKWESPLKKKKIFFFKVLILSAHHRQALMSV